MGRRQRLISRSILDAIFHPEVVLKTSLIARILAFFTLFRLKLLRYRAELFKKLRIEVWQFDEDEYRESFRSADKRGTLVPVGDLGYSGSTFFTTPNSKFLIKSLPRHFENSFFRKRLLDPYSAHMHAHPDSLLVRITDLLHTPGWTLGSWLGTAPSHHIIMENVLYGKSADEHGDKWETYDLKPIDYFYPERDIAGGALVPDSVKDRLVDKFNDQVRITAAQRDELLNMVELDTKLLEESSAVDYSLFLVRRPATPPRTVPFVKSKVSSWRSGVESVDQKWIYRAVLLDFFWTTDALQAKAMTGLVESYNLIGRQGPMSITTTPEEYRERFLKMVNKIVEVEAASLV